MKIYLLMWGRLPVWALGAFFGGWLAAESFMRIAWRVQRRTWMTDDGSR